MGNCTSRTSASGQTPLRGVAAVEARGHPGDWGPPLRLAASSQLATPAGQLRSSAAASAVQPVPSATATFIAMP